MPEFTIQEKNLLCLYEGANRLSTVRELNNMMRYLTPEEKELRELAEGAKEKLMRMTDDEYDSFALHELIL